MRSGTVDSERDLFHRLAVGVLLLPPLRQREGNLNILIDSMLASINAEAASQPGYKHKNWMFPQETF